MFCPQCKTVNLKQGIVKYKKTQIDYCPTCKGIWFDAGELEEVSALAAKDLQIQDGAEKRGRSCPKCQKALFEFQYPQTLATVDMCKSCKGLWLDAGELKEIETVRRNLQKNCQMDDHAEIPGIKGYLIRLINNCIDELTDFSSNTD